MVSQIIYCTSARDYIHVVDLALAYISALNQDKLERLEIFNIGGGKNTTVFEFLKEFEETSGVTIKFKYLPRRKGNLAVFW